MLEMHKKFKNAISKKKFMCLYMNPRTNSIPDFKSGTLAKPLILDMYGKKFMLHICCHLAEMKTGFIYSQGSKLMFELIKYIAT